MTILGHCSFEANNAAVDCRNTGGDAALSMSTSAPHGGTYCRNVTLNYGTRAGDVHTYHGADDGPFFWRVYFRPHILPTTETTFIQAVSGVALTADPACWFTLDESARVRLYNENGDLIGSPSIPVVMDDENYVELQFDRSPASGSRVLEAKLGLRYGASSVFATSSTETLGVQLRSLCTGSNLNLEPQTVGEWVFDDVQENDANGSDQNSYPGPGTWGPRYRIDENADSTQWEPVGTIASANWGYVGITHDSDTTVPPGADDAGTYIQSLTLNDTDTYGLQVTDDSIGASDTIIAVVGYARWTGATNSDENASFVVSLQGVSGGTKIEGPDITPDDTTWRTGASAHNRGAAVVAYTVPGGAAWTKADILTAVIGARISVAAAHMVKITALWVEVLRIPAPALPAPTITSFTPTTGTSAGGDVVTVTGTGFVTGALMTIGGFVCTSVVVDSATQIHGTTAPMTVGDLAVTIMNPDGQAVSS